jgi:hypothetical protein
LIFLGTLTFAGIVSAGAFSALPLVAKLIAVGVAFVLCISSPTASMAVLLGSLCIPIAALELPGLMPGLAAAALIRHFAFENGLSRIRVGPVEILSIAFIILTSIIEAYRGKSAGEIIPAIYPGIASILGVLLLRAHFRATLIRVLYFFLIFFALGFGVRLVHGFVFPADALKVIAQASLAQDVVQKLLLDANLNMGGVLYSRLLLPGEEPNYAAMQLTLTVNIIMILAFAIFNQQPKHPRPITALLLIVSCCIGLFEIFGTYSRTGFLAAAMIAATMIFLLRGHPIGRLVWMGFLFAGASLIPIAFPGFVDRLSTLTEQLSSGASARTVAWNGAWSVFLENPVFGAGVGAVAEIMRLPAHNSYLAVFAEEGFLCGLVAIALVFVVPLRALLGALILVPRAAAPLTLALCSFCLFQLALNTLTIFTTWMYVVWFMAMFLIAEIILTQRAEKDLNLPPNKSRLKLRPT